MWAPSVLRRGLADSCETDRQEAAQRNRCTVMVAVVVGGYILQEPTATTRILQTGWLQKQTAFVTVKKNIYSHC